MNFDYTDEQQMLKESVSRFVEKSYPFDVRLRRANEEGGFSADTWNTFAELGWLGASIPEEYGGLGFSALESAIIAEELGRALAIEPFLMCGFLPAALLLHCAGEEQKSELLPYLAAGETIFAAALSESHARGNLARVLTEAEAREGGYLLNGKKTLAVGAPMAGKLVVSARTAGENESCDGISLFLLDRETEGMRLDIFTLLDGTPAADVYLENVRVPAEALLGEEGKAYPGVRRAVDEALIVLCAELVGDMEDTIELTSEYIKTRKQFGVPIGSFQALQHRMADMAIELSQARATLHLGFQALAGAASIDSSIAVSGCKSQVIRSAYFVTTQGIQLHGGYGITEEYKVGHHFRRFLILEPIFGNGSYHENRYARYLQKSALEQARHGSITNA